MSLCNDHDELFSEIIAELPVHYVDIILPA